MKITYYWSLCRGGATLGMFRVYIKKNAEGAGKLYVKDENMWC